MNITTPKPIQKGDVAYIISPSAGVLPFAKERVKRAKANLEKLGLVVKFAPNAEKNIGYVSASIEERVADIHYAFSDRTCSLIVAAIGGNHSNQLISSLDYELIKNNPKTFVGYSDNTVLHSALLSQAGLQTFYGPCFMNQFGEFPEVLEYTLSDFKQVVLEKQYQRTVHPSNNYTDEILDWFKGDDSKRPRELRLNSGYHWWHDGFAEGWSFIAAIPSINHVLPSQYIPDTTGAVFFLDIPEGNSMHEGMHVSDVDAWLTDLENAGFFKTIKGLVIGRPYKYTDEQIDQLESIVKRILKDYPFPILFNIDFGHTDPMVSIPYGAQVRLDSESNTFVFL